MARHIQKRKRSTNYSRRPLKRRRSAFKKRGVRYGVNMTSNTQKSQTTGFRGRKTSRAAYRRHLWNSSLFTTHYRSLTADVTTHNTPADAVNGTVTLKNLYRYGTNPFWTALGGALTPDTGIAMPLIAGGNVTLRGGTWEIAISNQSSGGTDMKVKIFQLRTVAKPDFAFEPAIAARSWEPSVSPDFNNMIGRPFMTKEAIIQGGENLIIGGRFKMQKIDVVTYASQGYTPVLVIMVSNIGTTSAAAYSITRSYNLSFAMDAN